MKKSLSLLLAVLFCVSLVLIGCQKTETPAPTTGTTEATAAPEATAPAGNTEAVATDRADRESIVIALQGEPTTLDHQFAAEDGNMRAITWNVFEPLVRLNGQTLEPEPVLATEYAQVDDLTWEFKLRQGVVFHDGDTFDADDVVFSINRMIDKEFNSQFLSSIDTIAGAEAVDQYTVRIKTTNPDPILVKRVAILPIFSKSFTEARSANDMTITANGTGPFKFVEWKAGDYCAITAFDGYWGTKPAIKNAKFRFLEERLTALSALQAGEVDIAVNMYPEYVPDLPKVVSSISNEVYWVRFNQLQEGVFKSKDARLAAAYSIQSDAIADALFQGYATPCEGQMGKPGYVGYSENIKAYGYDPAKVQEYLTAAGYNGQEVELVSERGRWLKDGEVTEAIAADLQAAGFNVTTQFKSWNEWLDQLFDKEKTPDLFWSSNSNDFFDMDRPFSALAHSTGSQSALNNPDIDAKIDAARQEMDPAARQALYDELNQLFFDDPFALYVLGVDNVYGTAADLQWAARRDSQILVSEMSYAS